VASHYGYININWRKVNRHLEKVEREISEHDPSYLKNSVCIESRDHSAHPDSSQLTWMSGVELSHVGCRDHTMWLNPVLWFWTFRHCVQLSWV